MKRALVFLSLVGVAVAALAITSSPANSQGTIGPAPLVNVTTGGGLTKTGQKIGMTLCAADQVPKMNGGGTAWTCAADASGGSDVVQAVATTGTISDLAVNAGTTVLKFTGGSNIVLTGMAVSGGNVDGRTIKIDNSSTSATIAFSHDVTSTAANRFFLVGNTTHTIQDNASVVAIYSSTDSRWHLTTYIEGITAGTGLSGTGTAGSPTLTLNMAGAACTGSNFVQTISATGTGGCVAEVGDISGVTANSPLSGGGTTGALTVGMANGDRGDITLTTGTQTGDTWTVDPSTITSAKLNITTTSCSGTDKISAISAGGVGTCTADAGISGGTTNYVARFTSATAVAAGQIFDDNSNEVKIGGGADAATRADARFIVTDNGDTSLSVRNSTDNTEIGLMTGGSIVQVGSITNTNVGLVRFGTNFLTYDGSVVALLDNATISGTLGVTGALTFNAAGNVGNELTLSGSFVSNGTTTTIGNSSGDTLNHTGRFSDLGTLPAISTCASGTRTGGQWSFTVTPGSTTACTATFAQACGSAPTCSITPGFNTTAVHYISAVSGSAITFNVTGTGWSGSQPVHVLCICH